MLLDVQKLAIFLLFASVLVGSLMPAQPIETAPAGITPPPAAEIAAPEDLPAEPATQVDDESGAVTLQRQSDGHFYAQAQVNGSTVNFLVDTGATIISLTPEHARQAAVPLDPSSQQEIGKGAGGALSGQFVQLDRVTLGSKEVRDMRAAVIEGGSQSLLGQSFLAQFESVVIEGDRMVLR